jgi:dUTP pyrophosphatase
MITFIKLNDLAVLPSRANQFDAGLDISSVENHRIAPSEWKLIPTGLIVNIPENYYGALNSRSGLALKKGLVVHQGSGVIDCGYQGELKVILRNTSKITQEVKVGDRIAQLLICPVLLSRVEFVEIENTQSERGIGGFGSSGS